MNTELDSIKNELETLKTQMTVAALELQSARQQQRQATRRARLLGSLAFALVAGTLALSSLKPAGADGGYGPTLASLQNQLNLLTGRVTTVEGKTQFQSADAAAKTTKFVGCNVYVQSGSGRTNDNFAFTGLGNLIVGYDGMRGPGSANTRTGSHNLILGDENNYSSYGGMVAGLNNTISGDYASVSGGITCTASGYSASVSGGYGNTASGDFASLSGGYSNTASGFSSSASGGFGNSANGSYASVSGGRGNAAFGSVTSILGGYGNVSTGDYSIICGGYFCSSSGDYSANLGGFTTNAGAQYGHNP